MFKNRFTAQFVVATEYDVAVVGKRKDREFKLVIPNSPQIKRDMRGQKTAFFKVDLIANEDGSSELTIIKPCYPK